MSKVKRVKTVILCLCLAFLVYYFGILTHLFEKKFDENFRYPYDGDIDGFIQDMRRNKKPKVPPINSYDMKFYKTCSEKCEDVNLEFIFLVKSDPKNWKKRMAIRSSWGYEKRFESKIRTIFLIGERNEPKINEEYVRFKDLVHANFTDDYYNNTLKTMMGFTWAVKYCSNSKFYVFVDDDYYISTKNLLQFLKKYEEIPRFFAGYVSKAAPPQRSHDSKWYISLDEYPYDLWPPFINAGAYVLSKEALFDMYYASFYTKHFRFDDIYVGLLARKSKIEPYHCEDFHREKLWYNVNDYKSVIASHGYEDTLELMSVWTEQRSKGFA